MIMPASIVHSLPHKRGCFGAKGDYNKHCINRLYPVYNAYKRILEPQAL